MSANTTAEVFAEACRTISVAVESAGDADLAGPTPCTDFDLRTLLTHFAGTTTALARAAATGELDPEDPWGSKVTLTEDWAGQLVGNLNQMSAGWTKADIWSGSIENSPMPARAIGEMALIEVLLHGWDIARASGNDITVSAPLAAEMLRCVAETAEQGREYEAYGPEVAVAKDASDFDKALGLAGRDPNWSR